MSRLVRRVAGRIDEHVMAPAPAVRLAALRLLVGGYALVYLLARLPHWQSYAHFEAAQFRPVGLIAWALSEPLGPLAAHVLTLATIASAVPFVLGWRFRVIGPLFAILCLWTMSYSSSFGMVFHTENLLVLHVMVLGLSAAADVWSLDARRRARRGLALPDAHGRYGWPIKLMCWIVVIAYVLAGVAKVDSGGMGWIWGDELRNHIAVDNARKLLLGDIYSPLAAPLLHIDWLFRALATATLVLELGAPLALLGMRAATLWVACAWSFHLGVLVLMMIAFPYQMAGVAFACFFAVERPVAWAGQRLSRLPWLGVASGRPAPTSRNGSSAKPDASLTTSARVRIWMTPPVARPSSAPKPPGR